MDILSLIPTSKACWYKANGAYTCTKKTLAPPKMKREKRMPTRETFAPPGKKREKRIPTSEPEIEMEERGPVICYMKGRFGNQLFQYWICRLIADNLKRPLYLHMCSGDPFMLTMFPNLKYDMLVNEGLYIPVDRPPNFDWVSWANDVYNASYHEEIHVNTYAESYELVSKYEDIIRHYYYSPRFLDNPDKTISIHVRLGDLADHNAGVEGYLYFCVETAKSIRETDPNVGITIVSEEPSHSYTQKLINMLLECTANVMIMPATSIEDDFVTLRNSKYIIMQNSTFSWWAGFLANKDKTRVYAYASKQLGCGFRNDDLFRLSPQNFNVTIA